MRLLLLTNEFALPVDAGGVRRQLGLVTALGVRHEITLLARERPDGSTPALVEELASRTGATVETFPARPIAIDRRGRARAGRAIGALVRRSPAWIDPATSTPLRLRASELASAHDCAITLDDTAHMYATLVDGVPFVLDKHNVLGASRRAMRRHPGDQLEYRLLRAWERRTVRAARAVVVTSPAEADRLRTLYGADAIVVQSALDNVMNVASPQTASPTIAWLGDLRYEPNRTGLIRFVNEAWRPLGQAGATLVVIGRDPTPDVHALAALPGVEIRGFVADLDTTLARCRAAVAPLWAGAGIKIKTLTLMGAGLPVVGTPVAFEGINVNHGEDALIADTPDELASALRRVIDNPALAAAIGARAHARIREEHDSERASQRYGVALLRAVA